MILAGGARGHAAAADQITRARRRELALLTRRVRLAEPSRAAAALTSGRAVIEDWRPLGESLEWALGRRSWDRRGLAAFLEDGVPFMINADGVAAAAWAELLLDNLERAGRTPLQGACVLEIGVGSGLFTRHLLRAVARLSPAWAERLTVVATDASPRMLEDIGRRGVLRPYEGNVRPVVDDAAEGGEALAEAVVGAGYDAVFCNYVLDTLPFTVVRVRPDAPPTEVRVRTVLAGDADPEPLRRLAAARTTEALDRLLPIRDDLRQELGEFSFEGEAPHALGSEPGFRLLQHGVARCLDRCMALLAPGGFIGVRDYPFDDAPDRDGGLFQVYGGSTAVGLDFRSLELLAETRGWSIAAPEADDEDIRTRLLAPASFDPATADAFRRLFDASATAPAKALAKRARGLANTGFTTAATDAYRHLLQHMPDHWGLHAEASKLLNALGDHEGAAAVASAGLEANPISPELMNDLGDAHFLAGHVADAHRWFTAACDLAPNSPQARFNLSFTFARRGEHAEALASVAAGLAADRKGEWRERLLTRQRDLLADLDREWRRDEARAQDRRGPWRIVDDA